MADTCAAAGDEPITEYGREKPLRCGGQRGGFLHGQGEGGKIKILC